LFSALVHGKEADWSMGDDAPPAFLSTLPRTLWDYCKQRFAQVTNPPIDPLREAHVMSLEVHLKGSLTLPTPLIDARQLAGRIHRFEEAPLDAGAFRLHREQTQTIATAG